MVTVVVCVGSSCFLKGAPLVIAEFEKTIEEAAPGKVEIKGSFCMERCANGVTVRIGDQVLTAVTPDQVRGIFDEHVLPKVTAHSSGDQVKETEGCRV